MRNKQEGPAWVVIWTDASGRRQRNAFTVRSAATEFQRLISRQHTISESAAVSTAAICTALDVTDVLLADALRKREGN